MSLHGFEPWTSAYLITYFLIMGSKSLSEQRSTRLSYRLSRGTHGSPYDNPPSLFQEGRHLLNALYGCPKGLGTLKNYPNYVYKSYDWTIFHLKSFKNHFSIKYHGKRIISLLKRSLEETRQENSSRKNG